MRAVVWLLISSCWRSEASISICWVDASPSRASTSCRLPVPLVACERCSVSDHSPGPVVDDEHLARALYSPHHINRVTGEVKPASFGDALKRGLSVDRMAHISAPDLQAKIESKVARDKEQGRTNEGFYGVVTAKCEDLRACAMGDGRRSFCAYDTSADENGGAIIPH